jgi:predicted transcriptional regulator
MNSFKQDLLQLVAQLPDDATLDDFLEALALDIDINEGEADIAAGRIHSHEEVMRMLEQWNQSRSLNQ